jgi:hypothetical protein
MISRNVIAAIVVLLFLFSLYVITASFGLYLTIFTIVLLPAIIAHVYAMIKAFKKYPEYNLWIILSTLFLFAFSLVRPDADEHGAFSGYSVMGASFGFLETRHVEPWAYSLETCLLLLLVQIFINTYILRGLGKIPR